MQSTKNIVSHPSLLQTVHRSLSPWKLQATPNRHKESDTRYLFSQIGYYCYGVVLVSLKFAVT